MRTLAAVAFLAFALPAFGQGPNMQLTATVAKKGPGEWTLSGTCTNAGTSSGVMVYARYYGHVVARDGANPADWLRTGQVWTGTFVRADGSFSLTFKTPDTGFNLEVYTAKSLYVETTPPARIMVPVP